MTRLALLALVLLIVGCEPVPRPRAGGYQSSDADVAVTRIVHGSYVLSLRGTRLLVDPWFYSGVVYRQSEPLGLTPDTLPAAAAVVLTEGRGDHLDPDALAGIAKRVPRAVVPAALRQRLVDLGFEDVRGLEPWQRTELDGLELTAVPSAGGDVQLGYVVAKADEQVYIAGDTAPFDGLADIHAAFPHLALALLPIGGRRVLGVSRDMGPAAAAAAVATLQPRVVIPTHYGAQGFPPFVWYASDPVDAFRDALAERGLAGHLVALAPGESWHRF